MQKKKKKREVDELSTACKSGKNGPWTKQGLRLSCVIKPSVSVGVYIARFFLSFFLRLYIDQVSLRDIGTRHPSYDLQSTEVL